MRHTEARLGLLIYGAYIAFLIYGCFFIGFARTAPVPGVTPSFFEGLFHGLITPLAFIVSLFEGNTIAIYARDNVTSWYDFGFIIGMGGLLRSA